MAKKIELKDILELFPSLSHEDFMELKMKVEEEYKKRLDDHEQKGSVLKNGK